MTIAFVFPGQGSQSIGMLADLGESFNIVKSTFAEASDTLGYDLWNLVQNGPESDLNATDKTQPAMLAAGVSVWRVWNELQGSQPAMMAGHSLGEYSALVCAGALNFSDAIKLVEDRGRYMQQAVASGEGAMAAILGLEDDKVIEVCASSADNDVVEAVNFNSPGQVVIAGSVAAVNRAIDAATAAGAKKAILLPVSVPSHCSLMKPAAEKLRDRLANIEIKSPQINVLHNVDVNSYEDSESIKDALVKQLYQPVRWVQTIQKMAAQGVEEIYECGPGKVLAGLNKRIDRRMPATPLFDKAGIDKALGISA